MKKIINIFKKSKLLLPIFLVAVILNLFLFFYIPKAMEEGLVENIIQSSKNSVIQLQLEREYYVEAVVGDIKKYAPNISFDYNHAGVNGKLPFPTTTVHDLSEKYSKQSDVKFALYSNYPFLNRKDRVLTEFQKEAIREVEKSPEGFYFKKDVIDGKEVLRVAVADYMVIPGCVSCHNTHKLKDWDFDWKLGDIRGVLEVITPMDSAMKNLYISRNNVIAVSIGLMLLLISYFTFLLLRREKELYSENEILANDLTDISKDFDKYVIASKTDLSGIITYASKLFCDVSGYSLDELIGKNHNIVRHPDMQSKAFKDMWETIQSDKVWSGEVKNLKKDGGYYWVDAVISPLFDTNGKKIGYTAIRHETTDKKELAKFNISLENEVSKEVEKNRLKDQQMLQQSRLAQMGEMISMIAHQWRQPLNAISLTSNNLSFKCILDDVDVEEFKKELALIDEYSQHLSSTIDDFKNFFKKEKEKELITLTMIIKNTLKIIQTSLEDKNIHVVVNLKCNINFMSYKNEIMQVALNIIKNAEDALIQNQVENPTITIEDKYADGCTYPTLIIRDNAGGIAEDIMPNIFDPYFSTKKAKEGTGLGLYMSRTIIQEHCDGDLHVANDDDGAVFTIEFKGNNTNEN